MSKLINARYVLLTLAALVGIVIAVLIGLQIQVARQETIQTGTRSARNLASTLAQHTRQSLRAVDLILQVLSGPDVVPPLLDPSRKAQSHQVLRNRAASAEGVFAIIVFDKNGRIVSSSFEDDPEPRDLSDRPAFIAAREGREFTVAPPHRSQIGPAAGKLVMIITRRIESRDGQFLGTVEGSLSVDSFVNFYRSLDMGAQGIISVLRHDGTVLLRYPLEENLLGRSVSNPVFRAYLSGQGSGEVFSTYVTDNIVRLTAFRDVPEIDLVVSVGLSLDDLLAGWKRTAFTEAAAAAVVIMVLILLMLLANRYLSGRERERERFAVRLNRLATASSEIASIHTGAGLVAGLRRTVQELVPGAVAEVRFALERTGAQREPVIEARRITLPLQAKGGRVLGTLDVTRAEGPLLSSQDTAVLSQIALIGTVALENVELLAESHRLAVQAERARAEEAEARHQIEDVFATMSEGVYTLDHSWRFTFLNDNALALIARPREDLIGRVIWDVVPTASPIQKRFERVAKEQVPVEFEYEYETGTGTRWADVRAFPTIDGISVYIRDITQRVETESKLRQATRRP